MVMFAGKKRKSIFKIIMVGFLIAKIRFAYVSVCPTYPITLVSMGSLFQTWTSVGAGLLHWLRSAANVS